jgi:hypothetical protein
MYSVEFTEQAETDLNRREHSKLVKGIEFYLLMLERVLLEIRNMDDAQLHDAKSLAYIFHNLPGILRCGFDEETAEETYEVIRSRAEYFGLSKQIEEWEHRAFERIEFEQTQKQLQPT